MYAAAATPPTNASTSPTRACPDTVKSTPDTTSTPPKASTRPATTPRLNRSPRSSCHATTQAICRHTIAVADATEVSVSEVTQVPKWTASARPEAQTSRSERPRTSASSSRRPATTPGATNMVANPLRQNEMASGGTTIAAISGPDNDTAITPTAISSRVRTGPLWAYLDWRCCGRL